MCVCVCVRAPATKLVLRVRQPYHVFADLNKSYSLIGRERMIGDANVAACETAASRGAAKFVLISASPMNAESLDFGRKLPVLGAYVNAKHRAEESAREKFGKGAPKPGRSRSSGTESTTGNHQAGDTVSTQVLQSDAFALIRPGFIFGTKGGIPLHVVGIPMRLIFSTLRLNRIPGLGPIFFEVRWSSFLLLVVVLVAAGGRGSVLL